MKLATLKNNTRDGELVVVNRELTRAVSAESIAPTLQFALDHWQDCEDKLLAISEQLNAGELEDSFAFESNNVNSPLPRAYQWADGSAYVNHVELVRKARGAQMPEDFWTDPLIYQGMSDDFIGPCDSIDVVSEDYGIDFEAEIAVITDKVPMATSADLTAQHIKLIMLVNDVSLRNLIPNELKKGFGFFQSKPASSFSPVAVTPDELGESWRGSTVHLPLMCYLNDDLFGQPNAGVDMTFDFSILIGHAAKTRHLGAGTIIGSGTVSNLDRSLGSCCIAERRMLEIINEGEAKTPFMKFGDRIKIEMLDNADHSIFGAINQEVVAYK